MSVRRATLILFTGLNRILIQRMIDLTDESVSIDIKFCMLTYIYTLVFVRLVPHFMLYDSPLQCDFNIFKKLLVCPI